MDAVLLHVANDGSEGGMYNRSWLAWAKVPTAKSKPWVKAAAAALAIVEHTPAASLRFNITLEDMDAAQSQNKCAANATFSWSRPWEAHGAETTCGRPARRARRCDTHTVA